MTTRPKPLACPHAGLIMAPTGESWLACTPKADAVPMTPPFETRTAAGSWWTPVPGLSIFHPELARRPGDSQALNLMAASPQLRLLRWALPIPYEGDEEPPVVYIRCADPVSAGGLAKTLSELSWQVRTGLCLNKLELDSLSRPQQTSLAMLSNITPVILHGMTYHQADLVHRVAHQRRVTPVIVLHTDDLLVTTPGLQVDVVEVHNALNHLRIYCNCSRGELSRSLLHLWAMRRYERLQFGVEPEFKLPWEEDDKL